jgi:hypothetical protein
LYNPDTLKVQIPSLLLPFCLPVEAKLEDKMLVGHVEVILFLVTMLPCSHYSILENRHLVAIAITEGAKGSKEIVVVGHVKRGTKMF